jgi:hypothetical protein
MVMRMESRAGVGTSAVSVHTGRADVLRAAAVGYLVYVGITSFLMRWTNKLDPLDDSDWSEMPRPQLLAILSLELLGGAIIAALAVWAGGWVVRRVLDEPSRIPRAARAYAILIAVMVGLRLLVWWVIVLTPWRIGVELDLGGKEVVGATAVTFLLGHGLYLVLAVWVGRASVLGWPQRRQAGS